MGMLIAVVAKRDLPEGAPLGQPASARMQVLLVSALGAVIAVGTSLLSSPTFGILLGWDVAAVLYVARVWWTLWPMDAERTARSAVRVDPTRAMADLLLLTASVASLLAVLLVLVSAAHTTGSSQDLRITLGLASVVASWGVVHTVYALRYAAIYYTGPDGGVDFNEDTPPDYADFAYLSLTIGMTFQVSDTDLQSKDIRRTAVRHALLSYVFGTGVVATTVNLVASLTTK
ncbi:MAG: hypothetical protein JWQ48_1367 [Conexibacter sp.]|nr:hypothetical protein [Conexibacter sp.]